MTKTQTALVVILIIGATIRFWGISHRAWIDENKLISPSIHMVQDERNLFLVPPQSYYPHLAHYILAFVFWPIDKLNPDFSGELYHFVARIVTALFNLGTVFLVYFIGRRLFGSNTGLLAAALLATMPLHVKYSHFAQVDLVATFFMTAALLSAIQLWDTGGKKWYLITGILSGAAGASQYWGFSIGIALLVAHAKHIHDRGISVKAIFHTPFLMSLALIPITFAAVSPHSFLQYESNLASFEKIQARGAAGDLGHTRPDILWPLYNDSRDWGLSFTSANVAREANFLVFVLAILGCVLAWRQKDWRLTTMIGATLIVVYLAINGQLRLYAIKRLLPLGPFLALLASYAFLRLWQITKKWQTRNFIVGTLLTAVIGWNFWEAIRFDSAYAGGSSFEESVTWAEANIPHGSVILQHGPLKLLDPGSKEWKIVRLNEVYASFNAADPEVAHDRARPLEEWVSEEGVDYVALNSQMVDRYYDNTSAILFPETTASYRTFYDDIRSRGQLVYMNGPEIWQRAGPRLEIYDVRHLKK